MAKKKPSRKPRRRRQQEPKPEPPAGPALVEGAKPLAPLHESLNLEGMSPLSALGRTLPTTNALAKRTIPLIRGDFTKYAVSGGQVYDLQTQSPPMVAGTVLIDVPLDREEILKVFVSGWDEAKKELEDIAISPVAPASKAETVKGLIGKARSELMRVTYSEEMASHTNYAHNMGYLVGLKFEILRYPDILVFMPYGGVQGSGNPSERRDVQDEIEASQQPMPY